jgi:hypothetical protein
MMMNFKGRGEFEEGGFGQKKASTSELIMMRNGESSNEVAQAFANKEIKPRSVDKARQDFAKV